MLLPNWIYRDIQIATGDGAIEPLGLTNDTTGVTDVGNPASDAGVAPDIDDYELLLFSLGKQYRTPAMRNRVVFIGTDTTYRRARAIDVSASDSRRLFGMDHESYQLMNHPFKVSTAIGNANIWFGNMSKYRFYRRQGASVTSTDQGKELMLKNLVLLTLRGRFGGQIVDANGFVFSDSWQA